MVSFVVKLTDLKHKSSEAYLVKFKENLSCGFKIASESSFVEAIKEFDKHR